MSIFKKYVTSAVLSLALAIAAVGTFAMPANAGGYPIVYRQAGNHWSPMYGAPNMNVATWLAPGEQFVMNCYVDSGYGSTGNYWSYRWYYGQSWNHGFGWVHSSYVYYQWNVRHC